MKLTDYRGANLFDELVDAQGAIRPYYRGVADKLAGLGPEELGHKLRSLELLFLKQGITFTVYGDEQGTERVFPFDPFPRVIPHPEWETIEAGLVQRITALNLFLYDVYHEQRIIKDGIVPPEVVFGASHYRPEFVGVSVPKDAYIHVCGTDLIRDRDGRYLVLEDNGRCPSGVSYVLENRAAMKRVFPHLFGASGVRPVDTYPSDLLATLRHVAPRENPNPNVVLPHSRGAQQRLFRALVPGPPDEHRDRGGARPHRAGRLRLHAHDPRAAPGRRHLPADRR